MEGGINYLLLLGRVVAMNLEGRDKGGECVIVLRLDGVINLHRMLTTLQIHRGRLEILGELVHVHRGRHDEQLQRGKVLQLAQILRPPRDPQQHVGLDGTFVGLVQDHHRVIR